MGHTAIAENATATKKKKKNRAKKNRGDSATSSIVTQPVGNGAAATNGAVESVHDESHAVSSKQHKKQKQKRCSGLGITLLIFAITIIIIALGAPKAAKDERVRAAVTESVQRLNTTLVNLNTTLAEQFDVRIDGILERIANLSDTVSNFMGDEGPRPGQVAAAQGLRAHHPIIIIPGFVTSGLELWQGEECAQSYFRQRLWGTLSMAQTLLADRACWMRHMKLDPATGSDPPGIKLRAAKALEAVDYFVPGYWVFSKMVESLADLGYDNNNLVAVPYDWRLPMSVMESRDGYFTRVKQEVEMQYQLSQGIKPIMVSHSYGAQVAMAFLHWVDEQNPGWVDKHLKGYVNVAGPTLGLPKALSPLLSGETRETVDMMAGLAVLVEQYLGKQSRAALFRTWGSVLAMLPIGGPKVWGNATFAPDDDPQVTAAGRSYGGLIALVRSADAKLRDAVRRNDSSLISNDSLNLLTTTLSNWGNMVKNLGSRAERDDDDDDDENNNESNANDKKGNNKNKQKSNGQHNSQSESNVTESEGADKSEAAAEQYVLSKEQQQQDGQATAAAITLPGGQEQVRFLDVHSALLSLAMTAGEQLTLNLERWFAGADSLNLSHVLAHHRRAAAQLAAERKSNCKVQSNKSGEYKGTCEDSSSAESEAASHADAGVAGGSSQGNKEGTGSGDSNQGGGEGTSSDQGGSGHGSSDSDSDCDCEGCGDSTTDGVSREEDAGMLNDVIKDKKQRGSQPSESGCCKGGGKGGNCATRDTEGSKRGNDHKVRPVNPVTTPLPNAKDFKLYCFYGIGVPTERCYHYLKTRRNGATEWSINNMVNDPKSGLVSGVQVSPDGDGTVPLLSLGALCAGGWKTKRLNPAGAGVVTREYPNKPESGLLSDARGGPGASTHVEILGNEPMLLDLMKIAAGQGDDMEEVYHSNIRQIASRIPWDELG